MQPKIISEIIQNYSRGLFLMDNGDGLNWYASKLHALIPLDERFHIPRSLRKTLNSNQFEVKINGDFLGTVEGCASANRDETWINEELLEIYLGLNQAGFAYSFETWLEGKLAGGILGIVIGSAFIGESMFYHQPEASKVAMVKLVEYLKLNKFTLFDAQVQNPHLERFGAYEVSSKKYLPLLSQAIANTSGAKFLPK